MVTEAATTREFCSVSDDGCANPAGYGNSSGYAHNPDGPRTSARCGSCGEAVCANCRTGKRGRWRCANCASHNY